MSFRYAGLFSGVGMLEWACEQLGGEPVLMCEKDEFCQRVLRRRFPGVPLIEDVREVRGPDLGDAQALVGGFPCQDLSSAGRQAGIRGERSGLWTEFFRVISEARPRVVLIENVSNLRNKGLDVVLYDLRSIGYDAEWDVIPAAAMGAPHLRERCWIVARPVALAHRPVFGEAARDKKGEIKTFSLVGKKPRAGRMGEEMVELVPLAPRKLKRVDGWSYWAGARLGASESSALLPTPVARDDGKSPEAYIHMKQTKIPGGPRSTITSLAVLARNGFRQMDGRLWPTPNQADGSGGRLDTDETILRGTRPSGAKAQITLRDAIRRRELWPTPTTQDGANNGGPAQFQRNSLPLNAMVRLWPTTTTSDANGPGKHGEGGLDLRTRVTSSSTTNGSLNPSWTEWLMGMPLWWTDPSVPSELTTAVPWEMEPLHVEPRTSVGVKSRNDRLHAIGNSVVNQCAVYVLERALAATPLD